LYREQGDHGFAVDAELVEGFQVGLNSRAAARVASGDGEGDGPHPPSINETVSPSCVRTTLRRVLQYLACTAEPFSAPPPVRPSPPPLPWQRKSRSSTLT